MDLSNLNEVVGLATSALGLTKRAVDTATTVRSLFASDQGNDSEASKLLNDLATELTAANMMNLQLSEALKQLSMEVLRQSDFESEKARYELFHTAKEDVVFRLRPERA